MSRPVLYLILLVMGLLCLTIVVLTGKKIYKTKQALPSNQISTVSVAELPTVDNNPSSVKKGPTITESKTESKIKTFTFSPSQFSEQTTESNSDNNTWQDIKVLKGDTLSKIFARSGVSTKDIPKIITACASSRQLTSLQPNQKLKLQVDNHKQVTALQLDIAPGKTLHIKRNATGFSVEQKELPLEKQLAFGKGKINDSLFSAAKRAGLDYKVISQMVDIFGWNIDFALDLQPNDTFRVLYEEKYLDGEPIETGHIIAAEIVNDGTKFQAVRYTDKSGHTAYFSPDGYGMHQAFLRTPVNFTRISSGFGMRKHPVMHKLRQHKGVDYSAPKGTPVQTTGDGKVTFVGNRGGYGKVIEIQHGPRYSTLYAHLSKFSNKLRAGHTVKQGDVIGFVGATGLATGPHLHYEFRIDGIHRDPLTVAVPKKNPITDTNKKHFMAHAKEMIRLLDLHETKVRMAKNDSHGMSSLFDE